MRFITQPWLPKRVSEVAEKVGHILEGGWLHEDHLNCMVDRFDLSNVDGPTLSHLIKRRSSPIRITSSYWFITNQARVSSGEIVLNSNLMENMDHDELSYILGAGTALILIDESPHWNHPRARALRGGRVTAPGMLGALCSDLLGQQMRKKERVNDYGSEFRGAFTQSPHHFVD